jgi:hypothetical protein
MIATQSFVSPEKWYSLQYPRTWEMEVIEGIPTFFDGISPYGGALQVFAINLAGAVNQEAVRLSPFLLGKDLPEKMALFLKNQGISDERVQYFERDRTDIAACEYRNDGHFFLAMMAQRDTIFLLALYNCKGEPEKEEAAVVGQMLQTLTIL